MGRSVPLRSRYLLGIAAFVLLSACGVSEERRGVGAGGGGDPGFPVTIESGNRSVEISARPERIVSLSPTATEMLFAIEAGDQVVAVDDQSDYPPEAPTTKLSGYEPNIEAIAEYEPDLVIASDAKPAQGLKPLKIPVLVQPAAQRLDDTYVQIEQLGRATGHMVEANTEVDDIRSRIHELLDSMPSLMNSPSYYHELDDTYFTVTSDTFIGQLYSLAGLENIADKADKAGTGYPQLSAEYIVEADPDLIFLADTECCGQSARTVAKRPGWERIEAVRSNGVIELDDDVASRWGPRIVEFLEKIVTAVEKLET
jgi:iron complex transport system substrate-binding protein